MGTAGREHPGGTTGGMTAAYYSDDEAGRNKENAKGQAAAQQQKPVLQLRLKLAKSDSQAAFSDADGDGEDVAVGPMDEKTRYAMEWIRENFCAQSSGSVSRSYLYDKYCEMCRDSGSSPLNMATLGKHIRNMFPDIITRRLGNRGNSKYHYYGLAPLATSIHQSDEVTELPTRKIMRPRLSTSSAKPLLGGSREDMLPKKQKPRAPAEQPRVYRPIASRAFLEPIYQADEPQLALGGSGPATDCDQFVGPLKQACAFALGACECAGVRAFAASYQKHTVDVLRRVYDRDFGAIELLIGDYWFGLKEADMGVLQSEEALRVLSVSDDYLYQVSLSLLLANAIEPCPMPLLQGIRMFAKCIESWFGVVVHATGVPAIMGDGFFPARLVEAKVDLAMRFAMVLHRRASVNHLAQAACSVLVHTYLTHQMIHDWDHIDFCPIREQIKWIVGVKEPFISYVEISVKTYLLEQLPLPQWTFWLENMAEQYLAVEMANGSTLDSAAKALILAWSFYQTLILRDLMLRSAGSFGSFHILRLFLEDYLLFYIERKMDEHRRAVGITSFWPHGEEPRPRGVSTASPSAYEEYLNGGLQLVSSAADHVFSEMDEHTVTTPHPRQPHHHQAQFLDDGKVHELASFFS